MATNDVIQALTDLHNRVVFHQRPLPVPTSFLVDAQNRVAAIYKGPLSMNKLMADIQLLNAPTSQIAAAAFPFPGKVATHLFPRDGLANALAWLEAGHAKEGQDELQQYVREQTAKLNVGSVDERRQVGNRLAQAFRWLGQSSEVLNEFEQAIQYYQQSLKLNPSDFATARQIGRCAPVGR